MDDFRGSCGTGKYPLLTAIVSGLSGSSSADVNSIAGPSDVRTSSRLNDGFQVQSSPTSSRNQQLSQPDLSLPTRTTTAGSSLTKSRFSSSGNSNDFVNTGLDSSDSGTLFTVRRASSANPLSDQNGRRATDYDDVSASDVRRQSAAPAFDDVISDGNRQQQLQPRHRQESSFAQQDSSSFRDRKLTGGNNVDVGSLSYDDSTSLVGNRASTHLSRLPPTRRNDDVIGRGNSDATESDSLSSRGRTRGSPASSVGGKDSQH